MSPAKSTKEYRHEESIPYSSCPGGAAALRAGVKYAVKKSQSKESKNDSTFAPLKVFDLIGYAKTASSPNEAMPYKFLLNKAQVLWYLTIKNTYITILIFIITCRNKSVKKRAPECSF